MADTMTLLIWLAKVTALLMLAMGLTLALRRAPAGARYIVWLATLAALLVIPAMSAWAPISVAVLPAAVSREIGTLPAGELVSPSVVQTPSSAIEGRPGTVTTAAVSPLSVGFAVAVVWASVVALVIAWLLLGAAAVRRIMRNARTLNDAGWLTPLYETADRLDLDRVPRLVMSSAIEMPFACSILRPTIVLPAAAERWGDERRRIVLFHELAHIRRRDLLGHTLGRIVCAFYWFHPLVWSAAKKLRAESERACDDLVLACGARASDYANHLLDIVTSVRRQGAPATALPMANKREFEGRMLAILDPALKRATPSRRQQLLLALSLGLVAFTIAAVSPTRRVAETAMSDRANHGASRDSAGADAAVPHTVQALVTRERQDDATKTPAATPTVSSTSTAGPAVPQSQSGELQQHKQPPPDTALLGRVLRKDANADVRRAATWALQGRRDGAPLLVERLRVDEDASVREMAAWALSAVASSDIVSALSESLRRDESGDVRATAAWALGHAHGRADVAVLEAALGDSDADVLQAALWAIGHQGLHSAPGRVVALLNHDESEVRLMAAWVLGQVLDKATIPPLRDAFLKERDSDVQQAEFRALLFMGDRSQTVIDHAMASPDPDLRARGVRMIAGQGPGVWPWPWPWPQPRPSP
jgi:beta-lactamase regulating signal transducer with metallopeptidase domain/HEAT repeat protein